MMHEQPHAPRTRWLRLARTELVLLAILILIALVVLLFGLNNTLAPPNASPSATPIGSADILAPVDAFHGYTDITIHKWVMDVSCGIWQGGIYRAGGCAPLVSALVGPTVAVLPYSVAEINFAGQDVELYLVEISNGGLVYQRLDNPLAQATDGAQSGVVRLRIGNTDELRLEVHSGVLYRAVLTTGSP